MAADIINTIAREAIVLSGMESRAAGIVSTVIFALLPIAGIAVGLLMEYVRIYRHPPRQVITNAQRRRINRARCKTIVHTSVQSLGAVLYFYGDNISDITEIYGEELGCGEQCVLNSRIAATTALGGALVTLHFVPQMIQVLVPLKGLKETIWHSAQDMVANITKIDILYTTIAIMAQTDEFCGYIDQRLSLSFITIYSLLGIFLMVSKCFHLILYIGDSALRYKRVKKIALCISCVSLILCLVLYTFADNAQPIDCWYGCDFSAANLTMNELDCDQTGVSKLKLGLVVPSFVIFILVEVLLISMDACSSAEPLPAKRALQRLCKIWPDLTDENYLDIHLLQTLETGRAVTLLASLPAKHVAELQQMIPTERIATLLGGEGISASRAVQILTKVSTNRVAEILPAIPSNRLVGILASLAREKWLEVLRLPMGQRTALHDKLLAMKGLQQPPAVADTIQNWVAELEQEN